MPAVARSSTALEVVCDQWNRYKTPNGGGQSSPVCKKCGTEYTTAQAAVQKMFGITEYQFEYLPKPSPAFRSSLVIPRVIRMGFPHV